ncbi:MAG: 3-hydroxyacyl-ACP dehydratase FabZ [Clostridiales bacterium]|nr:3-hydroxyacyl-ACP dehydratase FabZ [Clostridiales bacterium]
MDIKEVMEIIPHRPPFLLIDKVIEIEPGKKITAIKNLSINEYFFQGHFPQEPIMPGVLIIEALAQAGAVALLSQPENRGKVAYLGAVDKAKFRAKAIPGDTLLLEATLTRLKANAGTAKVMAFIGGKKACEAEITFLY